MRDHGGPDTWGESQRLTAADDFAAGFGFSVSLRKDVAIVGAPFADRADLPFGLNAGAAYVFERNREVADTWTHAGSLVSSDSRQTVMGWSVSIDGDTAVAGGAAAAYVFAHDPDEAIWKELTTLSPGDTEPHESIFFGGSVSVFGDSIVVGAPDDDEKGGLFSRSGSAYVFHRNKGGLSTWGKVLKLTAADGEPNDLFGHSIQVNGSTAIVGTPTLGGILGGAYICALDALSAFTGACRRAIPVVNSQVMMSDTTTSCCVNSEFLITAVFTNTSSTPIWNPFFEVVQLRDRWVLKNGDGGPGGVGSVLTPDVGDGALSPGESVRVTFVIGIPSRERFWFRVNLRGDEAPGS
jgi:hypothetical protein